MMETMILVEILRDQDNPNVLDYIDEAADRLEQMAETIDYARTIQAEGIRLKAELEKVKAERDDMAAELKARGGCDECKYYYFHYDEDPCASCRKDPSFPAWEWIGPYQKGEKR